MIQERSAGAIVFKKNGVVKYLLLHYKFKTDYWDFPRGNIEKDEYEHETALREIEEETGIKDVRLKKGFEEKVNWFYMRGGKRVFKEVIFFLAETRKEAVKLSKEHIGYAWLSYDNAVKRLTFKNAKGVLDKANEFLERA